ncbi:MAG: squalene synthase HpnC [Polyangia bacterium]
MIRRVMSQGTRTTPELDLVESPPGVFSLEESYAYCERIARGHFDSYALARRFVPEALRPHVWALYAFARSADDFADEPRYEGRRRELLERWENELERAFHGEADHPIFIALADTVEKRELPITPLRDLLNAYVIDLSVSRYATAAQLERYCGLAAQPMGRLFLHLFGQDDPALQRFSDEICTAMQITKICQDVASDMQRDRVYLPAEDLRHFGVTIEMLHAKTASPELRDLVRYQLSRARSLFERGRPLIERLRRIDAQLAFQVALAVHSSEKLLDLIEAADHDVLGRRPRLGAIEKTAVLERATQVRWPDAGVLA